jgi:polyketide cyclase/dehydrase/lipid transport protein
MEGHAMASIHKEILVEASLEEVWSALPDVGDIHTRLARQFVVDTRLDGESRLVTFANGAAIRERIIDIDDRLRRLAYAVVDWRTTHHNASLQVFAAGKSRCRIVWIADLLPDDLADLVDGMMDQGCAAMRRTLETDNGHNEGID